MEMASITITHYNGYGPNNRKLSSPSLGKMLLDILIVTGKNANTGVREESRVE